ncbi:MAG: alanyl-tRNA editing protein [Desulfurococcales archaeon]|nr:alanyl-tRNA editing protein [Desulfurococcales archaeon]
MGTELLYQRDSYLKEMNAEVIKVTDEGVILDRTVFHPRSGGVANDLGTISADGRTYEVRSVRIVRDGEDAYVLHVLDTVEGLKPGVKVHGVIDWGRRYRLMRLHIAAHILSAIMYREYGALITGGDIQPDKAKDDFSIESMDKSVFEDAVRKANDVVKQGIEVKVYWLDREEAMKIEGIVKLASKMPPNLKRLRIVEIPGVDIQADGGPHVRNTSEVGEIKLLKVENKGRRRKRIYYTVVP